MLGEAAGLDVVLEQLLREILVHLSGLVSVHGIPTRLVQVWETGKDGRNTGKIRGKGGNSAQPHLGETHVPKILEFSPALRASHPKNPALGWVCAAKFPRIDWDWRESNPKFLKIPWAGRE